VSPTRVRQSRRKGASIGDAVSVAAPSRWANPYRHVRPRSVAVVLYRDLHLPNRPDLDPGQLRGRDLACYCALDQPCHADVLLELANREER
jgi:Domain of unknown function (DUF4326)